MRLVLDTNVGRVTGDRPPLLFVMQASRRHKTQNNYAAKQELPHDQCMING